MIPNQNKTTNIWEEMPGFCNRKKEDKKDSSTLIFTNFRFAINSALADNIEPKSGDFLRNRADFRDFKRPNWLFNKDK